MKTTTAERWYRFGWNDARGGAVGNAPKNATHRKYYRQGFRDYPSKNKYKKNPEWEINELILYAENTQSLHNQYRYIMRNLSRKYKKGIYDQKKAAVLWKHWIDEAVKSYNVEILGGRRSLVQNVFTVADRKKAAVLMEAQERGDVASGEYLFLDNPKGKRKMAKKKRSAKQLANDKRLGRMAKARAKKKRALVDPTKRKMTAAARRKRAAKPLRYNPHRKIRAPGAKRRITKRPSLKKSHLWFAFVCDNGGKKVHYAYITDSRSANVGITPQRGAAAIFQTKTRATNVANILSRLWKTKQAGVAPIGTSAAKIKAACIAEAGKA